MARALAPVALAGVLGVLAAQPGSAAASHPLPLEAAPSVSDSNIRAPSRRRGAVTALIVAPTYARKSPGSRKRVMRIASHTAWGHKPQKLLVLGKRRRRGKLWLQVLLPRRPNGTRGWIVRDKAYLSRTSKWVEIRVVRRQVRIYSAGRLVRRYRAVVGAPRTRTPRGLAAIYELAHQPDPTEFLGTYALHLTALSNVHFQFGGGPGRVAIHGRGGESFADPLGTARSNGCIRISNRAVNWMARRVPAGTPVLIRR